MSGMTDSVTVHIDASPEKVYDLVSDPTRIGEFSPETLEGRWIDGATGPAVGAKFQGHVKRNGRPPMYWTTCTVTAADPGREFTFHVSAAGEEAINTWRYVLTPSGGGVDVTESFELADTAFTRIYWKLFGKMRAKTNVRNMQATLERVKAVAESS